MDGQAHMGNFDQKIKGLLDPIHNLEDDWDSYGGKPVTLAALETAYNFLNLLFELRFPTPTIVPTSNGGLVLEWTKPDFELSFDIAPNGKFEGTYAYSIPWEVEYTIAS
jgi:hypothetical protein